MSFLVLPPEIVTQIFAECQRSTLVQLRLVKRYFKNVATPLLFSRLSLNHPWDTTRRQLAVLRNDDLLQHARSLSIGSCIMSVQENPPRESVFKRFRVVEQRMNELAEVLKEIGGSLQCLQIQAISTDIELPSARAAEREIEMMWGVRRCFSEPLAILKRLEVQVTSPSSLAYLLSPRCGGGNDRVLVKLLPSLEGVTLRCADFMYPYDKVHNLSQIAKAFSAIKQTIRNAKEVSIEIGYGPHKHVLYFSPSDFAVLSFPTTFAKSRFRTLEPSKLTRFRMDGWATYPNTTALIDVLIHMPNLVSLALGYFFLDLPTRKHGHSYGDPNFAQVFDVCERSMKGLLEYRFGYLEDYTLVRRLRKSMMAEPEYGIVGLLIISGKAFDVLKKLRGTVTERRKAAGLRERWGSVCDLLEYRSPTPAER